MEPDLYSYLDYREYLRAYYAYRKGGRGFSYRVFSRRAGLKSPNYLKLVIDGERNLSADMAGRFAAACGLDEPATRYFEALVAFNQARTLDERNAGYSKLKRLRRYRGSHPLDRPQEMYHSRWYFPAIRELVTARDFEPDPRWIARKLSPPITVQEAEEAVAMLLELGLLKRDDAGQLSQAEETVSTGPEMRSLHLANFHRTMIEHGKGSIDRISADQRDISSLTLCLGPGGIERVKRAVQQFRRELLELGEIEEDPRQVVQINFQLFPLSSLDETAEGITEAAVAPPAQARDREKDNEST